MWKGIDPIAAMQTQITTLYRKRHNLTISEFIDLDRKIDILGYIEICYEPFHLTGEEGILDEIDDYCNERLLAMPADGSGKFQEEMLDLRKKLLTAETNRLSGAKTYSIDAVSTRLMGLIDES